MSRDDPTFINTGPLIADLRIGRLDILSDLPIRLVITKQVLEEIRAGESKGLPAAQLDEFEIQDVGDASEALKRAVDPGEASVLHAALQTGGASVCIDERRARRVAREMGLHIRGSLGLLVDAKRAGIIKTVAPLIVQMIEAGTWYSEALVRKTVELAGELAGEEE